jgi:hypothetical protein
MNILVPGGGSQDLSSCDSGSREEAVLEIGVRSALLSEE